MSPRNPATRAGIPSASSASATKTLQRRKFDGRGWESACLDGPPGGSPELPGDQELRCEALKAAAATSPTPPLLKPASRWKGRNLDRICGNWPSVLHRTRCLGLSAVLGQIVSHP